MWAVPRDAPVGSLTVHPMLAYVHMCPHCAQCSHCVPVFPLCAFACSVDTCAQGVYRCAPRGLAWVLPVLLDFSGVRGGAKNWRFLALAPMVAIISRNQVKSIRVNHHRSIHRPENGYFPPFSRVTLLASAHHCPHVHMRAMRTCVQCARVVGIVHSVCAVNNVPPLCAFVDPCVHCSLVRICGQVSTCSWQCAHVYDCAHVCAFVDSVPM